MPFVSLVVPQVVAQPNNQTNVLTEGEDHSSDGESVSELEAEPEGGSSRSPLMVPKAMNAPLTVSHLTEGRSLADHEQNAPSDLVVHGSAAPVIATSGDSHLALAVKPGVQMVVEDAGPESANRVESRPGPLEPPSGSALLQSEAMVRRGYPGYLGAGLSDGKQDIPKTDSVIGDEGSADRTTPAQMNWYAQSLRNAQDSGLRTPWGGRQEQPLSRDGTEQFSELWGEQQNAQRDQAETKLPQAMVADRQGSGGPPIESIVAGAHGRAVSSPPPAPAPPVMNQAQPSMPAHDTAESSMRFMTRSVVLDVAQPDLGHVNIRVAMTNDVVHTQFSTERLEVGQFLVSSQDRLQAALQATGLDMGQFRVDIDRQSAGRSFQQDLSQEQGQTWNQRSHDMKWGQSPDRQDEARTALHGRLNVVA
ncbi:MAG: flagellar hook-length control protein FliK [Nitrospira sp.]|nr:flagellar hook-length control protein FliK [Nitrospira sp.]